MRQAIETKYIGPTDTKGARVKAYAQAGSVTVPFDYSENPHTVAAKALAEKYRWSGRWIGGGNAKGTGNVYVCTIGQNHIEPVLWPEGQDWFEVGQ